MLILLLDGLRVRGQSRLGHADPADRLGRFRLPFRARPQVVASVG
jgi:hypothetical protein